jgi:peptide/nickel transport system ATP-binding protein
MSSVLEVFNLKKYFPVRNGLFGKSAQVHAVDDISFHVDAGETLSIVGESGCGKSTVGRSILRLVEPTSGEIYLDGWRVDTVPIQGMRRLRKKLQVVYQDPFSSLNPRLSVRDIIAEPLENFGMGQSRSEIDDQVANLLDKVRLPRGGQRQRIGIARALAPKPEIIICDEAVSALDVSVKAQIVNLFTDLQGELGLALLFISHDLAIVEHLTHRVAVMYLGQIVEIGDRRTIFSAPGHPYTQALLSSIPVTDPKAKRHRQVLKGEVPSPINPPSGCRFRTRCPYAFDRCAAEMPKLVARQSGGHHVACHLHEIA